MKRIDIADAPHPPMPPSVQTPSKKPAQPVLVAPGGVDVLLAAHLADVVQSGGVMVLLVDERVGLGGVGERDGVHGRFPSGMGGSEGHGGAYLAHHR